MKHVQHQCETQLSAIEHYRQTSSKTRGLNAETIQVMHIMWTAWLQLWAVPQCVQSK